MVHGVHRCLVPGASVNDAINIGFWSRNAAEYADEATLS